jgi:hypothetical protein
MSKQMPLYLKPEQREALETLIKSGNAAARTHTHARILLLADRSQGQFRTDPEVAASLLCSAGTVANVRKRFLNEGLDAALYDKPRPGRAPKFTGDLEAQVTVLACSDPPAGHARWTVRLLAQQIVELGLVDAIGRSTVGERLKKTRLSPGK